MLFRRLQLDGGNAELGRGVGVVGLAQLAPSPPPPPPPLPLAWFLVSSLSLQEACHGAGAITRGGIFL